MKQTTRCNRVTVLRLLRQLSQLKLNCKKRDLFLWALGFSLQNWANRKFQIRFMSAVQYVMHDFKSILPLQAQRISCTRSWWYESMLTILLWSSHLQNKSPSRHLWGRIFAKWNERMQVPWSNQFAERGIDRRCISSIRKIWIRMPC